MNFYRRIPYREKHLCMCMRWTLQQDSSWVFNVFWTDEAHFSLHGDINTHNCCILATSNPRVYIEKPLHSLTVTMRGDFTGSFIIGPIFFETQCPVNGWKTVTVNDQRYLTLLRERIVSCLLEKDALSIFTFMQDRATSTDVRERKNH
ncbi:uncharacterized protein TNIN_256201 [Trichonephila inaurata madagascariensis]|uniref:Uncharacterized protein n=1 Tax=Trichonephila inaurata madagascariensis TaxID=2747483 RepID=A0A8X7CPP3_9ARAC|nr:uncharacterized protein TNIN_256201 [Trichonephila inaurata madagascariensis]